MEAWVGACTYVHDSTRTDEYWTMRVGVNEEHVLGTLGAVGRDTGIHPIHDHVLVQAVLAERLIPRPRDEWRRRKDGSNDQGPWGEQRELTPWPCL